MLRENVRMASGRIVEREIVVHPGAVALVAAVSPRVILMVRQYRHAAKTTLLEIPAGTLEEGEDAVACARRELLEETGYVAGNIRKLLQFYLAPGYSTELIQVFLAEDLRKVGQKVEEDEDIEVLEVGVDEALRMVAEGRVRDAKTIAAVFYYAYFMPKHGG